MHTPSRRARRNGLLLAPPLSILCVGLLTWGWSSAAFTSQTRNTGNSWETGSVALTDDDAGVAAFAVNNALPGDSDERCLKVTATASNAGTVKTYVARLGADGLENNILIKTEVGTGGTFGSCVGFVAEPTGAEFKTLKQVAQLTDSYANGALPWLTTGNAGGESKTYRVTWKFDTTGLSQSEVDALQGKSVSADVVWELQTT